MVCFNALSSYKPCENLFQKCNQHNYVLHSLYDTSGEYPFFKSTVDKLYCILNISRQYLNRGVRNCVEIKHIKLKTLLEWFKFGKQFFLFPY